MIFFIPRVKLARAAATKYERPGGANIESSLLMVPEAGRSKVKGPTASVP